MAKPLQRFWQFLNTDVQEIPWGEVATQGIDAVANIQELVDKFGENAPEIEALQPYAQQMPAFLEALNSPVAQLVGASFPLATMGISLLRLYFASRQEEPTLASSVAIVAQLAYAQALQAEVDRVTDPSLKAALGQLKLKQLWALQGEQLEDLSDRQAKAAVASLRASEVGRKLAAVLADQLQSQGAAQPVAEVWADRLLWVAQPLWLEAVASAGETVQPLAELYRLGGRETLERYQSLGQYLDEVIAKKPQEKVFNENFTFQDIYVPLLAQPLKSDGEVDRDLQPVDLETWVLEALGGEERGSQVLFVQGGPGRGKSVFCRMMADRLRREEYPRWVPILLRLRDLSILEKDFQETLRKGIDRDFATSDAGWLTDTNIRYVFLLDGFDELLMEGRTSGGLEEFLGQVGKFQESCARSSEKQHQVLITGRTMALQAIERRMPDNLQRVQIETLSDDQVGQWFGQWGRILGQDPDRLLAIWQDVRLPEVVRELTREPLLLYLFAAMHRDGELAPEMFEGADAAGAKVLIYKKTLDWVLTRQRAGNLNQKLTELETEDLRRILQEAGLAVLQSGRECASLAIIQERLERDARAKDFLAAAQRRLGEDPLKNALAVFYLKAGQEGGSVEFVHKSFGEFLCAERIGEALADWAEPGQRRQQFFVSDEQMHWEIYDLLAGQVLTVEVVEYLRVLWLGEPEEQKLITLFGRLNEFYDRWCQGEFIDMAPGENLPQRKMIQLRDLGIELGLRQVDVYTGLNAMILLLELHRYGQSHGSVQQALQFYPSGQATNNGRTLRLWQVIAYTNSIDVLGFNTLVASFLSRANFSRANFSRANLSGTNLSGANFSSADLNNADLNNANLNNANLNNANLNNANLNNANLNNANLNNANLNNANLNNANLIVANLSDANLSGANLSGANLSGVDLSGANLKNANLSVATLSGANLKNANLSGTNLSGVNLIVANLSGAYFSGAYLSGAYLSRAYLSRADLSRADLSRADLSRADLSRADFSGVDLSGANLNGANLSSAYLSRTDLSGANLNGANLSSAYLSRADLSRADLSGTNLSDANLSRADLSRANLRGADLSGADLSGADLSGADLNGVKLSNAVWGEVKWDRRTQWEEVEGLEAAIGVPEALKQQLRLD